MFSSSVLAVTHRPQVRRLTTTDRASRRLVGRHATRRLAERPADLAFFLRSLLTR